MKKIFILLTALMTFNCATAQSCLPEGITFSTQVQVNNFGTTYPDCTQIDGSVLICGYNITNLDGLNVLTSIGGNLLVECNEALTDIQGLANLTSIGGTLCFNGNMVLSSLAGLNNLIFLGGDFRCCDNVALTDLSGLESLTSINSHVWVNDNNVLGSLSGLNNVVSITGMVRVCNNPMLASLAGLENLTSIGGDLLIGGLGHLGSLGNPSLVSLMALYNLTSVGGNIVIGYNPLLESLAGLDNIDAGSIGGLSIYDNDTLSECEVGSICNYLPNPNGTVYISNNATGCNSLAEITEACAMLSLDKPKESSTLSIHPNPSSFFLMIETQAATHMGNLSVVDMRGRELLRHKITGPEIQINITNLPGGVYFIRLTTERTVQTGKFLKQ
jgi:hypothetical protein